MSQIHPSSAQSAAPFFPKPSGLTPVGHYLNAPPYVPNAQEIIAMVASFAAACKQASQCAEPECSSFGQTKSSNCACSTTLDALAITAIREASNDAQRAHRAHERRALNLQMNDKTGAFQ